MNRSHNYEPIGHVDLKLVWDDDGTRITNPCKQCGKVGEYIEYCMDCVRSWTGEKWNV